MKFKDLKENMFVKWTAERVFNNWNTFGVVTKITDTEFTIKTFDTFKESTLDNNANCLEKEIFPAEQKAILEYLEQREFNLTQLKAEKEYLFKKEIKNIDNSLGNIKKIISEYEQGEKTAL